MKVLVTGASGFIGSHLLSMMDCESVPVVRSNPQPGEYAVKDLASFEQWPELLEGVEMIVHLAARVHQMDGGDEAEFHRDNVEVLEKLATAAIASGVKRFVFISTIKVNGEGTAAGQAFSPFDTPNPRDAYARSKFQAEQTLQRLCADADMDWVIIRPPLVYGAGVGANFGQLLRLAKLRLPLPFAAVNNRRDMVSVYNLCDLIVVTLNNPAAANQLFLVADAQPYSLATMLLAMRRAIGRKDWLWSLPVPLLSMALQLIGKQAIAQRLFEHLSIDFSHTTTTLGWQPHFTLENTLERMADA